MLCPCCNSENVRDTRDADIRKTHLFGEGRHESKGDYTCNNCGCSGDCEDFTPCDHGNATSMPVGKCAMTPECLLSLERVDALNKTQPSAREILSGVPPPPQPLPPTDLCNFQMDVNGYLFCDLAKGHEGPHSKTFQSWVPHDWVKGTYADKTGTYAEPLAAKEADPPTPQPQSAEQFYETWRKEGIGDREKWTNSHRFGVWHFKFAEHYAQHVREAAPPLAPQRKEK
jgi:hypothetical protein